MTWALHRGDCLDMLRAMAGESVDSIVCDPPYELTSGKKGGAGAASLNPNSPAGRSRIGTGGGGFMGKAWDATGIAHSVELWAECLRVLKPGGHLVAFGGDRTVHRLTCAVEDAGFEVRGQVSWVYFCLDEETEILTDRGWARYNTPIVGRRALCFDVATGGFRWDAIDAQPVFDFRGVAYRLRGDRTDQLVTGEHRCLVERGGGYGFTLARDLAREREARVPVVEDLRGLLSAVPVPHEGAGHPEADLLDGLLDGPLGAAETGARPDAGGVGHAGVRGVRGELRASPRVGESDDERADVLSAVQRQGARPGAGGSPEPRPGQGGAGDDRQAGSEDARREQPGMEGRRHADLSEGALPGEGATGALPRGDGQHGEGERVRPGTSPRRGAGDRPAASSGGGGAPHQPRPDGQPAGEPDAVRDEHGAQAVRGARYAVADVVRVEPVDYRGKVWCVTVPTGAFVARRRGLVFVTGNSGFPKSLDVSKAIDAAAGAKREVVSERATGWAGTLGGGAALHGVTEDVRRITAPATPDALRWAGWGTATKPAIEPACLARKPFRGTVAANVLRYGTGALNIDGCRFAYGDPAWIGPQDEVDLPERVVGVTGVGTGAGAEVFGARAGYRPPSSTLGRWPANVYHCPKASRSERERGCEGLPARSGAEAVDREEGSAGTMNPRAGAGRTAGAVRNHHCTVKPVRLMRWLCRLVTPPGGLVVDPFSGSGSCGVAAVLEGFRYHGAELEPEYQVIAEARIAHAVAHPEAWRMTAPGFGVKRPKAPVVEVRPEPMRGQVLMFGGAA